MFKMSNTLCKFYYKMFNRFNTWKVSSIYVQIKNKQKKRVIDKLSLLPLLIVNVFTNYLIVPQSLPYFPLLYSRIGMKPDLPLFRKYSNQT